MQKIDRSSKARLMAYVALGLLLIVPLLLAALPTTWVEQGPVICPYRRFLQLECPGCGMTRALVALMHGDFEAALIWNKGVIVVAPLLIFFWLKAIWNRWRAL